MTNKAIAMAMAHHAGFLTIPPTQNFHPLAAIFGFRLAVLFPIPTKQNTD